MTGVLIGCRHDARAAQRAVGAGQCALFGNRETTRSPRREGAGGSLPVVSGSIGEGREGTTEMIGLLHEAVLKTGSRRACGPCAAPSACVRFQPVNACA